MNINDEKLAADVSALSQQIGGQHYTKMTIQPMEFATSQGYDFPAATILKYLSRHESKNGRQDVEKALHCVHLRVEIIRKHDLKRFLRAVRAVFQATGLTWVLSTDTSIGAPTHMDQYIRANGFTGETAQALLRLEAWVESGDQQCDYNRLVQTIEAIIASYDSTDCGDNNHE